jgi:predicted nucleic acid-binding protein
LSSFVVDASVAVKWVVPEIHCESARRLLGRDYDLLVPDFFFAEVANVFWKRVNRGEDSADDALAALEAIRTQPLQVHPCLGLITRSFDMAISIQRAVYDCVYLT